MRTKEQILAEMQGVQAQIPELNTLNSTSQVSFFQLLKNMWMLLVMNIEYYVETMRTEILAELDAKQIGNLRWYVDQAKAFQYGDVLTIVNGRLTYSEVDPAKQIVKQAAGVEQDGRLLIKAVKSANGLLVPLSFMELDAFKDYMRQVKYAGVRLDVQSMYAEELKLVVRVRYDRQVLNADGSSLLDKTKFPVLEAIARYLRELPYDSVFAWTGLTDYMQTVPGVLDFVITESYKRPGENFISDTNWVRFTASYQSAAGHMRLVAAESSITYV